MRFDRALVRSCNGKPVCLSASRRKASGKVKSKTTDVQAEPGEKTDDSWAQVKREGGGGGRMR